MTISLKVKDPITPFKQLEYEESRRQIRYAMSSDNLILFVGAGTSLQSGMPSWSDAVQQSSSSFVQSWTMVSLSTFSRSFFFVPTFLLCAATTTSVKLEKLKTCINFFNFSNHYLRESALWLDDGLLLR